MLARVAICAIVVFAAMLVVKNGWVLHRAGLTGYCATYASGSNGTRWKVCKGGSLQGRPDLTGKGCSSQWTRGALEYWFCSGGSSGKAPAGI